jgi:hypothetical protein
MNNIDEHVINKIKLYLTVAGKIQSMSTNFYGKSHSQLSKNLIYVFSNEIYQLVYFDGIIYQEAIRQQLHETSRSQ